MEYLREEQIYSKCKEELEKKEFKNKKVIVIIPDTTRSGPTSLFFKILMDILLSKVKKLDFLIALGTHPLMEKEKLRNFLDLKGEERYVKIYQHQWDNPEDLKSIGIIKKEIVKEISKGLMEEDIEIKVNSLIFNYDEIIIYGPVFPHEVVGFSGGYKYFFPGISGPEFLNKFHWLGALITNPKINGFKNTPVRKLLNIATDFIKLPKTLICSVIKDKKVYGLFIGGVEAWEKAADLSSQINIEYVDKSYDLVISIAPEMYEDIWTAGKCMYKLEPVVNNDGKLIIYAPHVNEISYTHGKYLLEVGYHTRDYFLKQWRKFKKYPGCILAHSTHVKGIGTYINGIEKPRIEVILATSIPEEICEKVNLGYIDYNKIKIEEFENREKEGILVVKNAGEVLYRRKDDYIPDIDKLYKEEKNEI
ncbi:MAG: lactate racemase domain-containing protein [Candidatus Omnitrophica bacterium]|nr:lactate racemase domain-containing protein [Candidatus Omnitrophota bacterium]MCM8802011.1 lactate racemase domain-containing protein [Candidatus Omnitrophota bacterium]